MKTYKFSRLGLLEAKRESRPVAVVLLQVSVFVLLMVIASNMVAGMTATYAYGKPVISEVAFKLLSSGL